MLEYDRIDISEGMTLKNVKKHLENVFYVHFIIFQIKTLIMDHIYVMVVVICL